MKTISDLDPLRLPFHRAGVTRPSNTTIVAVLIFLAGLLVPSSQVFQAASNIYWHFTIWSTTEDDKAEEWLWVTMVELSKEEVFPETAETVKGMGGVFRGTVLGHLRGAAWRNSHSYTKSRKCQSRPSQIEISWNPSWSEEVFAHGSVIPATTWMGQTAFFRFKFGLSDEHTPVLMADGRRRNLSDLVHAFVGPIHLPGNEREELVGKVAAHGINYEDMFVHYKFCGRSWVEQLQTPLLHYESYNLDVAFVSSPDWEAGVDTFQWHGFPMIVAYKVVRSHSAQHPFWKEKRLN